MSTQPSTRAAQNRSEILELSQEVQNLAVQLTHATIEGAYTLALGYSELLMQARCSLHSKLSTLAKEQRS